MHRIPSAVLDRLVFDANTFVETIAGDSNTAGYTERPLLAAAWAFGDDAKRFACFPEVLEMDSTCKTNALEKPYLNFAGVDADGKSFSPMQALLQNETFSSFRWALSVAAPWCLGASALQATTLFMTDEDSEERNAFEAAKAAGVFSSKARHRICAWHALHQGLAKNENFGKNNDEAKEFGDISRVSFFLS